MEPWYTKVGRLILRSVLFRIAIFAVLGLFGYSQVSESSKDDSTRSDNGEIVEAGDVGVLVLKVGDCVQLPPEFKSQLLGDTSELMGFSSFSAVPCTELHDAELFSIRTLNLSEFPGEDVLFDEFSGPCKDDYATYSGVDYDLSPHIVFPMVPSAVTWEQGDRDLQCFAIMENGDLLGATIKN